MILRWVLKWFFSLTVFLTPPAHALDLTEFVILNLSSPTFESSQDTSLSVSPGAALGLGISLGFKFFKEFDIEPGLIYVSRGFNVTGKNAPQTGYFMTAYQIPLVFRYWISESMSVGIGAY